MPEAALLLLLMPEESGATDHLPTAATRERSLERGKKVMGVLNYLEARCAKIIIDRPGKHAATEHLKHYCAEYEAWQLMRGNGMTPAGGTETSAIHEIAALLYEAVTGKGEAVLEHECRVAVERGKAGQMISPVDYPVSGAGRITLEPSGPDEGKFISSEDE